MLPDHAHKLAPARDRQLRRKQTAEVIFSVAGAATAVAMVLAQDWSLEATMLVGVLAAALGTLIGYALTQRTGAEPPEALREYAHVNKVALNNSNLPAVTPLLLQPWGRTDGHVEGLHPTGFRGRIGVFNFVRPHRMYLNVAMQMITRSLWPEPKGLYMLVALAELPRSRATLPLLLCERRYGGALIDSVEETARGLRRVHLESAELEKLYEVFTHPRQDPVWIRRLFSPTFVVWLSEEVAQELSFEIFDGYVCAAKPVRDAHKLSRREIERMSSIAAQLVARIETELDETRLAPPPALRRSSIGPPKPARPATTG